MLNNCNCKWFFRFSVTVFSVTVTINENHTAFCPSRYTFSAAPSRTSHAILLPGQCSLSARCLPAGTAVYHNSSGEANLQLMLPKAIGWAAHCHPASPACAAVYEKCQFSGPLPMTPTPDFICTSKYSRGVPELPWKFRHNRSSRSRVMSKHTDIHAYRCILIFYLDYTYRKLMPCWNGRCFCLTVSVSICTKTQKLDWL